MWWIDRCTELVQCINTVSRERDQQYFVHNNDIFKCIIMICSQRRRESNATADWVLCIDWELMCLVWLFCCSDLSSKSCSAVYSTRHISSMYNKSSTVGKWSEVLLRNLSIALAASNVKIETAVVVEYCMLLRHHNMRVPMVRMVCVNVEACIVLLFQCNVGDSCKIFCKVRSTFKTWKLVNCIHHLLRTCGASVVFKFYYEFFIIFQTY